MEQSVILVLQDTSQNLGVYSPKSL